MAAYRLIFYWSGGLGTGSAPGYSDRVSLKAATTKLFWEQDIYATHIDHVVAVVVV